LKKPSAIYISRKGTVKELHKNIAEILFENKKDLSVRELISMSRIWRLETGENVFEIEKYFDSESDSLRNLPI
jgi:hypothetical protein